MDKNNIFYYNKIKNNNLTCVYYDNIAIRFFKNGKYNNTKNAAYITYDGYKEFFINNICYGDNNFTKHSWRKFAKLQAFL
jgi:hypothetical protein